TGSTNVYTYEWTATPEPGSGITGSASGAPAIVSPTAGGTYTYIVTATDQSAQCVTVSSVTVVAIDPPVIINAMADPSTICAGETVTLSAETVDIGSGNVNIGTS